MHHEGLAVFPLDGLRRTGEGAVGIADLAQDLARLGGCRPHLGHVRGGVELPVRTRPPLDLERVAAPDRRIGIAGNDRDPAQGCELRRRHRDLEPDHMLDTGDLPGRGGVVAHRRRAEHRRPGDRRDLHPRQHHVRTVDRLAGGDVVQVVDLDVALADVAELVLALEGQVLECRDRFLHRRGREFTEAGPEGAARDLVHPDLDRRRIDAPLPGGGAGQHVPDRRTHLAHGLHVVAQRA